MWTALWHPMDVASNPQLWNNPQPNPMPETLTLWEIDDPSPIYSRFQLLVVSSTVPVQPQNLG